MAIDDFKEFLRKYPKLKDEVDAKSKTYQDIYNHWRMYGDDGSWDKYKNVENKPIETKTVNDSGGDSVKQVLDFVKGIKPESITNTLGTVQKFMSIFQSISQSKTKAATPMLSDSLFKNDFKRFD